MMNERFSDKSVLFVDDDERWLRLISKWFNEAPYRLHTANSGIEALSAIEKDNFDVVISDINMPVLSGSELMREVKNKLPQAVRIVMSGQLDVSHSIEAINKGEVYRYIVKPCDAKTLKLAVYQALQIVEQNELNNLRRIEIRQNNNHRIKSMVKSIRELENLVDSTYDGLLSVVQEMAISTVSQKNDASRTKKALSWLLSRLELTAGFKKQMEIAGVFMHAVCIVEAKAKVSEDGYLVPGVLVVEDEETSNRVLEIQDELNFETAHDVLEKVIGGEKVSPGLTMETMSERDMGHALLLLAHDIGCLFDDSSITDDEAIEAVFKSGEFYGHALVSEILSADIVRIGG